MSRQKVVTSLEGYDGPFFPGPLVDELNTTYYEVGAEANWPKIADPIESFEEIASPTTKDGYNWFGLSFKTPEGRIAVLFPRTGDQEKREGVSSNRSIATYKTGEVGLPAIKLLLHRLHLGFLEDKNLRSLEEKVRSVMRKPKNKISSNLG